MDKSNSPENFAKQKRAAIVAPAGCGKTELIVRSVNCCTGRQLVLTHTHAGVDSLKARFQKYNTSSSLYHVETIHSFALRYASSYPQTSHLLTNTPKTNKEYENVIEAASCFLDMQLAKQILQNSYAGVFVDEYQDCTIEQHQLIMKLVNLLPCRIVGDPLQGIFDFCENQIVNWERDVYPSFFQLDDLTEPWRWKRTNPQLGEWLLGVRSAILENKPIDISRSFESFHCFSEECSEPRIRDTLLEALKDDYSTYVITVPDIPHKAHYLASKMQNSYKSIEPVTSEDLFECAILIDTSTGIELLSSIFKFADLCLTHIAQDCKDVMRAIRLGKHKFRSSSKIKIYELGKQIIDTHSYKAIYDLYNVLISEYRPTLVRYQLWTEMSKSLHEVILGNYESLEKAAWEIRTRSKYVGRRIPKRCISRTLLLKGLECNHAIIVDADLFDVKNLYVAMTRPSHKLHLLVNCSSAKFNDLRPHCPQCNSILVKRKGGRGEYLGCSAYPRCTFTQQI